MSSREWQLRVQDILGAIANLQEGTHGMKFETFAANDLLIRACLYDFIVIGEASVNIPVDLQACYPEIPWRLMSDMRNILVHEYFRVDLQLTWATI